MSKFEFINTICESTLISNTAQLEKYNAREIADLIFLYFIAIQVLKTNFESAPFAANYASNTNGNFDSLNQSGTDLHILIHSLFGKNNESIKNMLKDQEASNLLLSKLRFDVSKAKSWLSNARNVDVNGDQRFLMNLENGLQIGVSNYKSIRRLASDWNSLDQKARMLVMTRLLQAFKAKAPRSELLPSLERVAKQKDLIIKGAKNAETSGKSSSFFKKLAVGAAVATGIGAYLLHGAEKGINKDRK